jgi:hypothetical protein
MDAGIDVNPLIITGSVKYFTLRRSERVLHGSSV